MNKREAKRRAWRMAWYLIENHHPEWDPGVYDGSDSDEDPVSEEDAQRLDRAFEEIKQTVFNRGHRP